MRAARSTIPLAVRCGARAACGTRGAATRAVDVHSHVYLPAYMQMLRERTTVPRVIGASGAERLVILPGEDAEKSTQAGRPVGSEYWDVSRKLAFMDKHGIEVSVLSLANPWLDFLDGTDAAPLASRLNDQLQEMCEQSGGRLYGFGVLPTRDAQASAREVARIAGMDRLRGVIMGTSGAGKWLDDPVLEPVWAALAERGLVCFVHPHYGVGTEHFGGFGHALFLALGFTFETSVAVARFILSGAFDRHPDLKLLLAHSGGTLPFLAGRLDSCVKHDLSVAEKLQHPPSHYLRKLYFDAIQYHRPSLKCVAEFAGTQNMMFGTDHPFFPPSPDSSRIDAMPWPSTTQNLDILDALSAPDRCAVLRENAYRLLNVKPPQ